MTSVAQKTRYTQPDYDTYMTVLQSTQPETCLMLDGTYDGGDAMLFRQACEEAMMRVPMNDPPKGAFNVSDYVTARLGEALRIRDAYYRAHFKTGGNA